MMYNCIERLLLKQYIIEITDGEWGDEKQLKCEQKLQLPASE